MTENIVNFFIDLFSGINKVIEEDEKYGSSYKHRKASVLNPKCSSK